MKMRTAKRLVAAAQEMGSDVRLREEYSGRGMYGESTVGITIDDDTSLASLVAAASGELDEDDRAEFVREVGFIRRDSMGRGVIFY